MYTVKPNQREWQMNKNILIIEDDRDLVEVIEINIRDLGFQLDRAFDGETGLSKYRSGSYDLVILDLMLPKLDGLEVCKKIREANKSVPIIMLTSKSEEMDKILGLELGADDYITKPFSIRELIARIKANLRSIDAVKEEIHQAGEQQELHFGDLVINLEKRRVMLGETKIELTAKEFDLLVHFAMHPGRNYTREELLNSVWGYQFSGYDHTVNSHINRLRHKIEKDPTDPKYVKTVWGYGYRFADAEELGV
jgi:DNA-binding response OmpR family regulator